MPTLRALLQRLKKLSTHAQVMVRSSRRVMVQNVLQQMQELFRGGFPVLSLERSLSLRPAIVLLPLALIMASSAHASLGTGAARETWEDRAEQAVMLMGHLDSEYRAMQRAYALLKAGEERSFTMPAISAHASTRFSSPQEEYQAARERAENLREAIALLRVRLVPYGKKAIAIDLSSQQAVLVEAGMIVARYPVSSGAWKTPTPTGNFEIHTKQKLRVSSLDVPYRMPYYMAFTKSGSHGLHALPFLGKSPESSGYWQEALSHIGIPVSHGCIRFLPEDAIRLYEWAEVGTKVRIGT